MPDRAEFLFYGRRLHNVLRTAINTGGDGSAHWEQNPKLCEHHACASYLISGLAYLEGIYGTKSWHNAGAKHNDFDAFIAASARLSNRNISKAGLDALVCIRNSLTHNGGDLSKNTDTSSLAKVSAANIEGVLLNGPMVTLESDGKSIDFMNYPRVSVVAVAQYNGDG